MFGILAVCFVVLLLQFGLRYQHALMRPPMVSVNLDQQDISSATFDALDLKQQLVKIIAADTTQNAVMQMDNALTSLAAQASNYQIIAGIEIDAAMPLSANATQKIAELAHKSVFVSLKARLQQANDWEQIFAAEQQNASLLTTIYGSTAVTQLMMTQGMGAKFISSGILFSYFYMPDGVTTANASTFWQELAAACQTSKQAHAVMMLDSGAKAAINTDAIMQSALMQGGGYLILVGGADSHHFSPAVMSAKTFVVWRNVDNHIQGFSYQRKQSPDGLYLALGTNKLSLSILEFLTSRSQHAAAAGINLLSDAENNNHHYAVLLSLANTTIANGQHLLQPPPMKAVLKSKLNIILVDPSLVRRNYKRA
jgi:hypothetical protein